MNFLSDQREFQKTTAGGDDLVNFITSHKKRIDEIYKKLVDSNSMSRSKRRHLKPKETRPGIIYGSCRMHKKRVDSCPPFRTTLSALQIPTYKIAKFLVTILDTLTTNKYTVI